MTCENCEATFFENVRLMDACEDLRLRLAELEANLGIVRAALRRYREMTPLRDRVVRVLRDFADGKLTLEEAADVLTRKPDPRKKP